MNTEDMAQLLTNGMAVETPVLNNSAKVLLLEEPVCQKSMAQLNMECSPRWIQHHTLVFSSTNEVDLSARFTATKETNTLKSGKHKKGKEEVNSEMLNIFDYMQAVVQLIACGKPDSFEKKSSSQEMKAQGLQPATLTRNWRYTLQMYLRIKKSVLLAILKASTYFSVR